ncbi:hypothetical protein [Polaromonas jejuensis]|uniref:PsiF repeat-containing protein n=1 Tax=Polaromonas jejuensis TaxID=457502 RepID=A0ABW0Q9I4_9BURK|nr:hypothetical protein [Polaromonas jejuensis]
MTKNFLIRPALAFMVAAVALVGSIPAHSTEATDQPAKTVTKKKAAKTKAAGQGGKVKFMPGSGETAKERSARLKRECKGRVNAGACEGYAN